MRSLIHSLLFLAIFGMSPVVAQKNEPVPAPKKEQPKAKNSAEKLKKQSSAAEGTIILLETDSGKIKIRLYDETPLHRDNFIKLVESHFYDSLLFHRVIQDFMIQGGDPDSKRALPGAMLGNGDPGYTIPAEFNPKLFHKKGALAAARTGDNENPLKASSGCQFYIVQGKKFTDNDLDIVLKTRTNFPLRQAIFMEYLQKPENSKLYLNFVRYQQNRIIMDSMNLIIAQVEPYIEQEIVKRNPYVFSAEQREAYKTVGGTPHLDNGYTVFGEVIEGLEVVDKIAAVKTAGQGTRPVGDVRIKKASIIKKSSGERKN